MPADHCCSEIEDFTQPWPYASASIDYVHIRLLYGSVPDWTHVYDEAFRVLKPGGWLEHLECEPFMQSSNPNLRQMPKAIRLWNDIYREGGNQTGQTFEVLKQRIQDRNFERLGMVDIVSNGWLVSL